MQPLFPKSPVDLAIRQACTSHLGSRFPLQATPASVIPFPPSSRFPESLLPLRQQIRDEIRTERLVIRKAISCDICGTEMLSANHWFVARESGNELRISPWSGHNQFRGSCRHLCGHKCLHKFLDDFTARALQPQPAANAASMSSPSQYKGSLTPRSLSSHLPVINSRSPEPESPAHLLAPPQPFLERSSPHQLYAEAWKRERDRQQKITNHRSIA